MSSHNYQQVILIISGNLSFLNWLTILPSIFCFDDFTVSCLFSERVRKNIVDIKRNLNISRPWGKVLLIHSLQYFKVLLLRLLCSKSVWLVSGTVARIPEYPSGDELTIIQSGNEYFI